MAYHFAPPEAERGPAYCEAVCDPQNRCAREDEGAGTCLRSPFIIRPNNVRSWSVFTSSADQWRENGTYDYGKCIALLVDGFDVRGGEFLDEMERLSTIIENVVKWREENRQADEDSKKFFDEAKSKL